MKLPSLVRRLVLQYGLITILLGMVFYLAGTYWPTGPDYYFTFRPITEAYLRGTSQLYGQNNMGYFLAPWGLLVFLPTLLFPLNFGEALLNLVSICGILVAGVAMIHSRKQQWLPIVLSIASLHTIDLLIRGNVDGLLALGIGLGWMGLQKKQPWLLAASLWLLSIKPVNVILAGLFLLWAVRDWKRRDILVAAVPTLTSIILSPFISGLDWPFRYYHWMQINPPMVYLQTSLWRTLDLVGVHSTAVYWGIFFFALLLGSILIVRSRSLSPELFGFILALNLLFSTYTLGSHYVILVPAFIVLVQRTRWGNLVWLLTLTPLLRLSFGFSLAPIDILYPLGLFIWLGIILLRDRQKAALEMQPAVILR